MKIFKFLLSTALILSLVICSATVTYAADNITIDSVTFEKYVDRYGAVDESLVTVKVAFTASSAPEQISLLLASENITQISTSTKSKIIYMTQDITPEDGIYEFVIEKAKVQTATGLTNINGCTLYLKLGGTKISSMASKTVVFNNPVDCSVSGNVKAFGSSSKDVTVELLSGTEVVATTTVAGNSGTYLFEDIAESDYTVRASKTKHATREYEVAVTGKDVTQDVEIWLYGDVTGDGVLNSTDILQLNRSVANLSSVFGQAANAAYRFTVANITNITMNDSNLNSIDILQINRKVANMTSIFDKIA